MPELSGKRILANCFGKFCLNRSRNFLAVGRARLELDAGVNVLGVFAENHHVDLLRRLDRGGHALEPAHGPQTHVQIQQLAQRHIERANAAADRRRERAFDGDQVVAAGRDGFIRQPAVVCLVRLLAGEHLHPVNLALAAIGFLYRRIEYPHAGAPDVAAGAVAFDEGNDGLVRHLQFAVGDRNFLAPGGDLHVHRLRV